MEIPNTSHIYNKRENTIRYQKQFFYKNKRENCDKKLEENSLYTIREKNTIEILMIIWT